MRKELNDISDNSSSLLILPEGQSKHKTKKSQVAISIDALLGELSDIKADNGIIAEDRSIQQQRPLIQQNSSILFNVLEGHSSEYGLEEEDQHDFVQEESEFENIEHLVEDEDSVVIDESSVLQEAILPEEEEEDFPTENVAPEHEETEEEAYKRKSDMFSFALMSLTPADLSFSIRTSFKQVKTEECKATSFSLSTLTQDEQRDSIISKPPQVTKMSYCVSDASQNRKRDIKLFRKTSNESAPAETQSGLTQLKLGQEKSTGRLSLERKAATPIGLHRRLIKGTGQHMATVRKLKFIIDTAGSPKSTKLAKSKAISSRMCKKPPTTFNEFRLSHQKPKGKGRRALLEDLYKTSDKVQSQHKRPKLVHQ